MTTLAAPSNWFRQAELWLDGYGKPAWIVAMVLGFILFWPIGLALLAYMIWGKHMFTSSCKKSKRLKSTYASSGNTAFDAYKAETLRRLEDEQADFDAFLARLRETKDKAEFDAFMSENRKRRDADTPVAQQND